MFDFLNKFVIKSLKTKFGYPINTVSIEMKDFAKSQQMSELPNPFSRNLFNGITILCGCMHYIILVTTQFFMDCTYGIAIKQNINQGIAAILQYLDFFTGRYMVYICFIGMCFR